ncbi:alpha/beta-hydrolase [Microthyrium microscopicum]|uniref:Alpha/beta-hydrolase n=1 Tax=Microthyrium microscopicum TaxID=703497 RepID=A0A6A6UNB9_9PEZI|nr:alpha/beta-hydrolase [Microthyrium microscopicum]
MKVAIFLATLAASVAVRAQEAPAAPKTEPKPAAPKGKGIPKDFGKNPVALGPAPKGCSKYELIVARGTSEPGPFGLIAGDPLVARVTKKLPDSRGYAVQYPASMDANSVPTGAKDIINRLKTQTAACPEQKFALVGYSQGARTTRNATAMSDFDPKWYAKIVALVMYGDPGQKNPAMPFPKGLQEKLLERCGTKDPACDAKNPGEFSNHLVYNGKGTKWQDEAADFVVAGFEGKPLPKYDSEPHD